MDKYLINMLLRAEMLCESTVANSLLILCHFYKPRRSGEVIAYPLPLLQAS